MTDVPTEGPAFEAMMREIDAKLKAEGVEIPSRPISAVGEVSIRYGDIPIPLGDGAIKMPPELERHRPLAAAIRKWYDDTYGDRIKIDMSAGRIVLLLEGELYTLQIPASSAASTSSRSENGFRKCRSAVVLQPAMSCSLWTT